MAFTRIGRDRSHCERDSTIITIRCISLRVIVNNKHECKPVARAMILGRTDGVYNGLVDAS